MEFYLTQKELAKRLKLSPRTLEGMRARETGPDYAVFGRLVRYPITAIEKYERDSFCEIMRHRRRQGRD